MLRPGALQKQYSADPSTLHTAVKTHDLSYNEQSMEGTEKLMRTEAEDIRAKLPCVSLSIRYSGQLRSIFRGLLTIIASNSNVRELLVVYFIAMSQECSYKKSVKLTFQYVAIKKSFDDKQIHITAFFVNQFRYHLSLNRLSATSWRWFHFCARNPSALRCSDHR